MSDLANNSSQGFGSQPQGTLKPLGTPASPAGFAAPASIQMRHESQPSAALASRVLRDPLLLRRVSDRVYELFLEDMRLQHDRSRGYGGRYG